MSDDYDNYNVASLIRSLHGERSRTTAEMINAVSEELKIEPKARNATDFSGTSGTNLEQNLLYMILKLGERVVELESTLIKGDE